MSPPKSKVWKHFKWRDSKSAECKYCHKIFRTSGNSTNLQSHLKSFHSHVFSSPSRPGFSATPSTSKSEANEIFPPSKDSDIRSSFKKIVSFKEGDEQRRKINDAILYFISKDTLPFYTVEKGGFLSLVKILAPLYKVPSRNTLKKILNEKYSELRSLIQKHLNEVNSVTLACDI